MILEHSSPATWGEYDARQFQRDCRGLGDARNMARILARVYGAGLAQAVAQECSRPVRLDPRRLSRFLALVLRHRAHAFGFAPDGEGFVPLEELIAVVERHANPPAGRAEALAVLADPLQPRFELRGGRYSR
jgi:hypothetical protein